MDKLEQFYATLNFMFALNFIFLEVDTHKAQTSRNV